MEYKTLGELAGAAEVSLEPALARRPMTKRERLERWATLLEREPERQLSSVEEVEYGTIGDRRPNGRTTRRSRWRSRIRCCARTA